jgi:PAS domain-containing protein
MRDITARKRAEEAVVWLAAIVESSQDAIYRGDLEVDLRARTVLLPQENERSMEGHSKAEPETVTVVTEYFRASRDWACHSEHIGILSGESRWQIYSRVIPLVVPHQWLWVPEQIHLRTGSGR